MKKKVYLRIHPKRQEKLKDLLNESLDKVAAIDNVDKVEGSVGLSGEEIEKKGTSHK